jgi:hypothetical protein
MASKHNPDGSADYFVRHPDAVGANPVPEVKDSLSIKKPVEKPTNLYSNEQQQGPRK